MRRAIYDIMGHVSAHGRDGGKSPLACNRERYYSCRLVEDLCATFTNVDWQKGGAGGGFLENAKSAESAESSGTFAISENR